MKTSRFLQTVAVCALGGCALTHYESLDQKTETEIAVSSNVPASLWIKGKELQPVRKEHILKQAGLEEIVLKAEGYHDAHVLIYRSDPTKKNVTSHESTAVWTTKESSDVTSNVSDLGADAATTSPTSTVKLVYNIGKFVVDLVVLPFDFTTKFNPLGYYLAYDKNQFYVEMTPLNAPEATIRDVRKMQVKKFVLKNYTGLAKGDGEYIGALTDFSGLTKDDVTTALKSAKTPAEAADAVAARLK